MPHFEIPIHSESQGCPVEMRQIPVEKTTNRKVGNFFFIAPAYSIPVRVRNYRLPVTGKIRWVMIPDILRIVELDHDFRWTLPAPLRFFSPGGFVKYQSARLKRRNPFSRALWRQSGLKWPWHWFLFRQGPGNCHVTIPVQSWSSGKTQNTGFLTERY